VFVGGAVQVLSTALLIGSIAWAFGNSAEGSVILGLVLSLSSTAIVMQLLAQRNGLVTPEGRSIFAVLMFQDFAVIPLLVLMDMLGKDASGGFLPVLCIALLKSALAIGVIYLLGSRFIAPLFRAFAHRRQPEVFVALTLLVTLGIAWLTAAAGLSLALGAFLAGMLMAETEYRHEVEVTIEPFKGLLMGLFFMSVGLGIDLGAIAEHAALILASALGLMLMKALVVGLLFRAGGLRRGASLESGLLLSQGGEFAFVIVGYALSIGLLPEATAQFMLLVVSLSMLLTPVAARIGGSLRHRLERRAPAAEAGEPTALPEQMRGHVLIAGFGRVGQLLARILDADNIPWLALDTNASQVATARQNGLPVYYGDASRLELLKSAHAEQASIVVLTMDSPSQVGAVLRSLKGEFPRSSVVARARDGNQARRLLQDGASAVVPETLEAGLQMAGRVLQLLGTPEDVVLRRLETQRDAEQGALRQSSD